VTAYKYTATWVGLSHLLEAAWDADADNPTPNGHVLFQPGALEEGSTGFFRFDTDPEFSDPIVIPWGPITLQDISDLSIPYVVPDPLMDDTWYMQVQVTDGYWSASETLVLDSLPYMTSATLFRTPETAGGTDITLVDTLVASQPSTFAIGGTDAAEFEIQNTDELHFVDPPDVDAPTDSGTDNVYNITITPTAIHDSDVGSAQAVAVQVTQIGYEDESEAIFAAFSTPPDAEREELINTLVLDLKAAGVWTKLGLLYVFQAADSQAARINWMNPGTHTLSVSGVSPSFTADTGFFTNGSEGYFTLAQAYSTFCAQNDHHLGAWLGGTVPFGQALPWGRFDTSGTLHLTITSTPVMAMRSATLTAANSGTLSSATGHFVGSRRGAGELEYYLDGASVYTSSEASTGAPVGDVQLLRSNGVTPPVETRYQIMHLGDALSDTEALALYNAFTTYRAGL
jgi:hypothetical protein